jgi:hypothetical protein
MAAQTLAKGAASGMPWQKRNKTRPWRIMQVPRTRQELPPAAEFSGSEVPSARIARRASAC